MNRDPIHIAIASIPSRMNQLERVIHSVYNQADHLYVYLNNYAAIPHFLRQEKITIYDSNIYQDIGDIGKFFGIFGKTGYLFTMDDDILYPANYIEKMVEKIDRYSRKVFVCVHANILPKNCIMTSYYKQKTGLHFSRILEQDQLVDVPGTGTLGFHSSLTQIPLYHFLKKNMTDLWLAKFALEKTIKIIAIQRPDKWLQQIKSSVEDSILSEAYHSDMVQTDLANYINSRRLS